MCVCVCVCVYVCMYTVCIMTIFIWTSIKICPHVP